MEDFRKFTDQKDPTKKLDLDSISLEEQYTKLTEEEKLIIGAKMLGMDHLSVSIDQFLTDDFYLGLITNSGKAVFPFWRDKLRQIFPNPLITAYPYLSFGGSIVPS
ncbi:hypothetical protein II582_02650 [bacterium]|nr:hypothetical protein [bacterium]